MLIEWIDYILTTYNFITFLSMLFFNLGIIPLIMICNIEKDNRQLETLIGNDYLFATLVFLLAFTVGYLGK